MSTADTSRPADPRQPDGGAPDADVNQEHRGAPAYENSGPGTPGNAGGAVDGGGATPEQAEELSEQATVSSPAPGSGA